MFCSCRISNSICKHEYREHVDLSSTMLFVTLGEVSDTSVSLRFCLFLGYSLISTPVEIEGLDIISGTVHRGGYVCGGGGGGRDSCESDG